MRKSILVIAVLSICGFSNTQEIQHEAIAINIEVPVRVFNGDTFIDSLTIQDFEIFEDGIQQSLEASYLINKTNIKRKDEELRVFTPKTDRQFLLMFEIVEYLPKVGEVIDYFFSDVIMPGDALIDRLINLVLRESLGI